MFLTHKSHGTTKAEKNQNFENAKFSLTSLQSLYL